MFTIYQDDWWYTEDWPTKIIGYGNIKTLVGNISEKYGYWLDTTGYLSNYVTVTGFLKKEHKFHDTKLFCSERKITRIEEADLCDRPFNHQVMLATSGAVNAGIDNKNVHGVFHFEFPSSVEDFIREEGRAGWRSGADHTTDWHYVCVSLESFLSVLRRVLTTADAHSDYKEPWYKISIFPWVYWYYQLVVCVLYLRTK